MDIKYAYTILYVPNVEKTMNFYNKAFGFEQKMMTPEKDYGEMITGATTIAFASIELGKSNFKEGFRKSSPKNKPFGIEIVFASENVEDLMARALKVGAIELAPIKEKPWGQKVGYVKDINGFLIELCTPMNG